MTVAVAVAVAVRGGTLPGLGNRPEVQQRAGSHTHLRGCDRERPTEYTATRHTDTINSGHYRHQPPSPVNHLRGPTPVPLHDARQECCSGHKQDPEPNTVRMTMSASTGPASLQNYL